MKKFSIYILSVTSFFLTSLSSYCQFKNLDKNILIGGFQTSRFYSNDFNRLGISSAKDSIQNLVIKSSQGVLQNMDSGVVNGYFNLTDLKNGNVTISVFAKSDTGLNLKNYKTFSVVTKPLTLDEIKINKLKIKPEINLKGFKSGKIALHDIKDATEFTINKPYKIKTMIVYFGSYIGICSSPILTNLKSEKFDEYFKSVWKRLGVGSYIQLEQIEIIDEKEKIYRINPIDFRIDKD